MLVVQKLILFLTQKKSTLFAVVKPYDVTIEDLKIGHDTISWCDRLKYLGVLFKSGRTLLVDNEIVIRKFYADENAIIQSC